MAPCMRWLRAPSTSRSRSASRSSRTRGSPACLSARKGTFEDLWQPGFTPPGAFAQLGAAYAARHGLPMADVKRAMAHVSWKSHENAVLSPKAHLRNRITIEQALAAPMVAYPLGLYRLLRRERRRGLRHRHDARDCGVARQARHGDGQGARARAVEWRRDGSRELGWRPHADHAASPPQRAYPRSRHRRAGDADRTSWKCTTASRSPSWC